MANESNADVLTWLPKSILSLLILFVIAICIASVSFLRFTTIRNEFHEESLIMTDRENISLSLPPEPTATPTLEPSTEPTLEPTLEPTVEPTSELESIPSILARIYDHLIFTADVDQRHVHIYNENALNFSTGHTPYFNGTCPLLKFGYICYPFQECHSCDHSMRLLADEHSKWNLNAHTYFTQDLSLKYYASLLRHQKTIFDKGVQNVSIYFYGNSHLRQMITTLLCALFSNKFTQYHQGEIPIHLQTEPLPRFEMNHMMTANESSMIPCIDHVGHELTDFIHKLSNGHVTGNQYMQRFELYRELLRGQNIDVVWKAKCDTNKLKIHMAASNSSIYYNFAHHQANKSLISSIRELQSAVPNISQSDNLLCRLDVIVFNIGNEPRYNVNRTQLEYEWMLEYRHKFCQRQTPRLYLMYLDRFWNADMPPNLLHYLQYEWQFKEHFIYLPVQSIIERSLNSTYQAEVRNPHYVNDIVKGEHFCLPGLPSHFMLVLLESLNFVLDHDRTYHQ